MKPSYKGTGVAMVTPFTPSGEIDGEALTRHSEGLIQNGVNYLVVLGTTAETPVLSPEEKSLVIQTVKSAGKGRVPVVAGAGGNDTRAVIGTMEALEKEGIDALLSVVPYYNKPTQEGIYQHFSAMAAASELPLILYNVPGRTGTNMQAETTLRLAHDHPGKIVAIKEASGSFDQVSAILQDKPDDFQVLSGDDAITLPMIALGAAGVISVIGNGYPGLFSTMVQAALDGAMEKAKELHFRLYPMMRAIFKEGNPAGIKASMAIQGWIENVVRLPLVPCSESLYREIEELDRRLR